MAKSLPAMSESPKWHGYMHFHPVQPTPLHQEALLQCQCQAEDNYGILPWRCHYTCKKQLQLSKHFNMQNVQAYRPISFAKKADEIARPGSTVAGRFWSNACHLISFASGNGLTDTKGESVNQLFRSSCNVQTMQQGEKAISHKMLSLDSNSVQSQMHLEKDGLMTLTFT